MKKAKLNLCIEDHFYEDRISYCGDKFEDNAAKKSCFNTFCNTCCTNELGEGASGIAINTCAKTCDLMYYIQ